MGQMTSFGGGRRAGTGYLATSQRVGPCVLILHEFFGLTPSFRDMADRLNDEGFTVLAPDLYGGRTAATVEEAKALVAELDEEATVAILKEAVDYMRMNWHPRVGVVGFSLGAGCAIALAQEHEIDATVLYYGLNEFEPERFNGPLQGHFADDDEWESLADAEAAFKSLAAAGVEVELCVYPGTGHWFANPGVPHAYVKSAAETAWRRTLNFLTHHLA
jgi:carboxymethylenebutenolidase